MALACGKEIHQDVVGAAHSAGEVRQLKYGVDQAGHILSPLALDADGLSLAELTRFRELHVIGIQV